jgi:2-oxoglutarate dehydrogenase E2 component (dihydrolipoamide succinyltransferase)
VTVGQDIAKLETGGDKPTEESKSEAPKEEPKKEEAPKEEPKKEKPAAKEESKPASPPPPPKQESKPAPPPPKPASTPAPKKSDGKDEEKKFTLWSRDERRVKMNRMRLRIAERLKQAQNTAASLSTFQEVDMGSLIEFRAKYKDEYLKKTGIKIGFMGAFARAATLAMKDIPSVNAGIEGPSGGDTIVYHDYVDISVAVATEKGLTTPVVRNVESMDILQIEKVISDLGKKARDNKLTIEDMAGGTFTISNVSGLLC